ncbi:MAG: exodeoxyribonuclease VII large subunit [Oscillospiraceae bacterium]|nr:exodeoxyribonuclease VII large subunit [Oscillospiraceae bacterium]
MAVLTVSQINRYMASKVREDRHLQRFLIKGEISNFTAHRSGHFYFSLKDAECTVKAVMFRTMASRLQFMPENGMHVIVSAGLTVYERDGVYQLNVTDMQPDGVGAAALALEQLKEKLRRDGLFDSSAKRPLPTMPRTIGVVTSGTGAALQDILQILRRRCPIVNVKVFSVLVQGEQAPQSICRALRTADQSGCDVIILGRGGGSAEDLRAFNAEAVAYAIYDCSVPVISAVGHETDVTIADAVADHRAPTPSAAAELAVPDIRHLHEKTDIAARRLHTVYTARLRREQHRAGQLSARLALCSPGERIRLAEARRQHLTERISRSVQFRLAQEHAAWKAMQDRLHQLDPLQILERGYAAVYDAEGQVQPSARGIHPGDAVKIRMQDGILTATVEEINEI